MSIQPLYERVAAGEGCSDIVSHLPVLRQMVVDVDAQTVVELGVRGACSTVALLRGV